MRHWLYVKLIAIIVLGLFYTAWKYNALVGVFDTHLGVWALIGHSIATVVPARFGGGLLEGLTQFLLQVWVPAIKAITHLPAVGQTFLPEFLRVIPQALGPSAEVVLRVFPEGIVLYIVAKRLILCLVWLLWGSRRKNEVKVERPPWWHRFRRKSSPTASEGENIVRLKKSS